MNRKLPPSFRYAIAFVSLGLSMLAGSSASAQHSIMFTNPIAYSQDFGSAVAAVAPDQVLIGDPGNDGYHGSVYRFHTNGTLIQSFHNPTLALGIGFGSSLAMVGPDHFVGGAPATAGPVGSEPGAAHLFHVGGALVTTFTNPAPFARSGFGTKVAAIGADRVLISADEFPTRAGVAYIFGTNGNLLTTITNPAPMVEGSFGYSMCVIGLNQILIAAQTADGVGAVYLFNTNGTQLKTITPPNPSGLERFGASIAPMDGNRIIIGAPQRNNNGTVSGAINIFTAEGTFLSRIRGPGGDFSLFGQTVAALGNRLIIGAAGEKQVYLYEHCGNPIRGFLATGGSFGAALTVVGNDDLLIGGPGFEGGFATLFFRGGERIHSLMVESDFAAGLEGWTSAPQIAAHDDSGGVAYVHEQANDGVTNFWRAPAKFLGNKSGAYNGKLTFEQKTSQPPAPLGTGEAILRGNGLVLVRSAEAPNASFTTHEIPLSAAGWRINDVQTGLEPTETQFLGVLSSLTALEIRAEFSTIKPETNTLDNVRILQPQAVCDTYLRVQPDPAGVRLEWPVNALNFNLYGATNLSAPDWTIIPITPTESNGLNSVTDNSGGDGVFYRLSRP